MILIRSILKLNIPTKISIVVGLIIIIAGVYYTINDLATSGITMSESGEQSGTGVLDGKGMIICGIIIIVLCSIIFNTKLRNDSSDNNNRPLS
jgi:hypothetical protein